MMELTTAGEWEAVGTMVQTPPHAERTRLFKEGVPFHCKRICVTDNPAYIPDCEAHANARLIAAAKDLLAACEGVVHRCDPGYIGLDGQFLKVVKAAICKANGTGPMKMERIPVSE